MIVYENALRYWMIARRYHANREYAGIRPVAVKDMMDLLPTVRGDATRRRVQSFISQHGQPPVATA